MGLEKILASIDARAQEKSREIIRKAELEAEQIVLSAKKEAEVRAKEIFCDATEASKQCIEKIHSTTNLKVRNMLLSAKQELVDELIQEAKKTITKLSTEDYFELILKMVDEYSVANDGEIVFSANDNSRITKEFKRKLNDVARLKGVNIAVSEQVRDIDGGFVLVYGEIEENCSFDALLEAKYDEIYDVISDYLWNPNKNK